MKYLLAALVTLSLTAGTAFAQSAPPKPKPAASPKAPAKVKCAVMGDEFVPNAKSLKSSYKGKTYYFCCPGCKPEFDKNPAKYAVADKPAKKVPVKPATPAKPAPKKS
jgi:YHS domain-containing protein